MRRLIAVLAIILIAVIGVIGYRLNQQKITDKDGNPLRYTFEEVEENGLTGVFVHNEDDTFSPAIQEMPNFQGRTTKKSAERFVWYVETDEDMDNLIPTVTSDSELVVIYNVDGDLPGSYYLEKYGLKGYTIGAHIRLETDKTMHLMAKNSLTGSNAAATLSGMDENTNAEYTIAEISGSDVLPINNVDPNMNLLLGLTKDKLYEIKYYQGTKEKTATFRADAKVFQSEKYIPISTPYRKTNLGYFAVNLPLNLANGYYYLSDIGFFAVKR